MNRFIDIHTHILFGVDDGAEDLCASIGLLREGIRQGVYCFFLTPHLYSRAEIDREKIIANFSILQKKVKELSLPCQLYLGGEVNFTYDLFEVLKLDIGTFQTNPKAVLLEFPHDMFPSTAFNVITRLIADSYLVIVAHPERNGGILSDFKLAEKLKKAGCLLQLTTSSINGVFGDKVRKTALKMIKKGLADFVASDTHSLKWRSFGYTESYQIVLERFGADIADSLFQNNQLKFILKKEIE